MIRDNCEYWRLGEYKICYLYSCTECTKCTDFLPTHVGYIGRLLVLGIEANKIPASPSRMHAHRVLAYRRN